MKKNLMFLFAASVVLSAPSVHAYPDNDSVQAYPDNNDDVPLHDDVESSSVDVTRTRRKVVYRGDDFKFKVKRGKMKFKSHDRKWKEKGDHISPETVKFNYRESTRTRIVRGNPHSKTSVYGDDFYGPNERAGDYSRVNEGAANVRADFGSDRYAERRPAPRFGEHSSFSDWYYVKATAPGTANSKGPVDPKRVTPGNCFPGVKACGENEDLNIEEGTVSEQSETPPTNQIEVKTAEGSQKVPAEKIPEAGKVPTDSEDQDGTDLAGIVIEEMPQGCRPDLKSYAKSDVVSSNQICVDILVKRINALLAVKNVPCGLKPKKCRRSIDRAVALLLKCIPANHPIHKTARDARDRWTLSWASLSIKIPVPSIRKEKGVYEGSEKTLSNTGAPTGNTGAPTGNTGAPTGNPEAGKIKS